MELTASDRSGSWTPVVVSFLAGVTSASVLWYASAKFHAQTAQNAASQEASKQQGWLRDIQSRIGELPSLQRRQHWPWNRKSRSNSSSNPSSPNTSTHSSSMQDIPTPDSIPPPPSPMDKMSGPCIGSIFGLDVGGTLAKLVYFENKSEPDDPQSMGYRERTYRSSASAQAVVMARRAAATNNHMHRWGSRGINSSSSTSALGTETNAWIPKMRRRSMEATSGGGGGGHGVDDNDDYRVSPDLHHHHSSDSNKDLEAMNIVRQESLPDDLHAYAETVMPPRVRARSTTAESSIFRDANGYATTETDNDDTNDNSAAADAATIRKSRSSLDFSSSRDHKEALDRFYNFARRLDSYREGVRDHKLSFYSRELGGEFHFIRFETRRMPNAMDLIRANNLHLNIAEVGVAGGGAHKFAEQWEQDLGIEMKKQDELDSLVAGMQFVLSTVVGECYTFRPREAAWSRMSSETSTTSNKSSSSLHGNVGVPLEDDETDGAESPKDRGKGDEWWWSRKVQRDAISYSSTYPYLLVTIGTGVSILRVDGPRKHVRVSGSTIGGGTYLGLIRLLTDFEDFDSVMQLAERGDPTKVDMMVGDIYGENSNALEKMGLASNLVASSFGKLVAKEDPALGLKEEDLARALLLMVTNNIGQVAYLNAQLHKTPRIYFVGNFLRQNKISQRRLSYAINYWSKGNMEALFLEHEGYFGALGAFLLSQGLPLNASKATSEEGDGDTAKGGSHRRSQTMGNIPVQAD